MPLLVTIKEQRLINEETFEVRKIPETTLKMEHSLLSISKWEALWHEPLLADRITLDREWTNEMALSYFQCMTINGPFDPIIYAGITEADTRRIEAYMNDTMTASTFAEDNGPNKPNSIGKVTTAEEIYYSMFKCGIPKECEKWHVNRLLALIRTFSEKDNPKKISEQEHLQRMYNKNLYRQNRLRRPRRR